MLVTMPESLHQWAGVCYNIRYWARLDPLASDLGFDKMRWENLHAARYIIRQPRSA